MASADYYKILEISRTARQDDIKAAFRRLAKVRHPDKNPGASDATANFQLLHDAYATLYDPLRRHAYDAQYSPQNRGRAHTQGTPAETTNTWGSQSSETLELRRHRQRVEAVTTELRELQTRKHSNQVDLSAAQDDFNRLQAVLQRLREAEAKFKSDEAWARSWWGFLWRTTLAQEEQQNRDATARRTGMIVIEAKLDQIKSGIESKSELLENLESDIRQKSSEKLSAESNYRSALWAERKRKQDQERERSAEAERERQRCEEVAQQAAARRRRAEAEQAASARRQREEAAKEAEDRCRKDEALKSESRMRQQTNAQKDKSEKTHTAARNRVVPDSNRSGQSSSCRHRAWWDRVSGPGLCQRCKRQTPRFFFQCPSCQMQACADCRIILKRQG